MFHESILENLESLGPVTETDILDLFQSEMEMRQAFLEIEEYVAESEPMFEAYAQTDLFYRLAKEYGVTLHLLTAFDPDRELCKALRIPEFENITGDEIITDAIAIEKLNISSNWAKNIIKFFSVITQKIVSALTQLTKVVGKYEFILKRMYDQLSGISEFNVGKAKKLIVSALPYAKFKEFHGALDSVHKFLSSGSMDPDAVIKEVRSQIDGEFNKEAITGILTRGATSGTKQLEVLGYRLKDGSLIHVDPFYKKYISEDSLTSHNWNVDNAKMATSMTKAQVKTLKDSIDLADKTKKAMDKLADIVSKNTDEDKQPDNFQQIINTAKRVVHDMNSIVFAHMNKVNSQYSTIVRVDNAVLSCKI